MRWETRQSAPSGDATPHLSCGSHKNRQTQRCVLAMKSWDSSKASALWILPSPQRRWPSCCTWKKKWLSPQKAAKCHHDNGWRQRVYKHLPSSHFTFQTQIDVLAKEKDERRVCNTYCSVMSQIVSLYLQKKKRVVNWDFTPGEPLTVNFFSGVCTVMTIRQILHPYQNKMIELVRTRDAQDNTLWSLYFKLYNKRWNYF